MIPFLMSVVLMKLIVIWQHSLLKNRLSWRVQIQLNCLEEHLSNQPLICSQEHKERMVSLRPMSFVLNMRMVIIMMFTLQSLISLLHVSKIKPMNLQVSPELQNLEAHRMVGLYGNYNLHVKAHNMLLEALPPQQ